MRTGTALDIVNIGPGTGSSGDVETSDSIRIGEEENTIIVVLNKTPNSIQIKYLGSIDELDFIQLGATATITDGSVTPTFDTITVDDPWPFIRVEVDNQGAAVTDGSTISVKWASKRSRLNVV